MSRRQPLGGFHPSESKSKPRVGVSGGSASWEEEYLLSVSPRAPLACGHHRTCNVLARQPCPGVKPAVSTPPAMFTPSAALRLHARTRWSLTLSEAGGPLPHGVQVWRPPGVGQELQALLLQQLQSGKTVVALA